MKQLLFVALAAVCFMCSTASADLITPGDQYTVRVSRSPLVANAASGDAHTFDANVTSGVAGPQNIGLAPETGFSVQVQAEETFTSQANGDFVFTLSITSQLSNLSLGDLSQGTGTATGIFIGQNTQNSLPAGVTADNAAVVDHTITSVNLEAFALGSGALLGNNNTFSNVAAFNDPSQPGVLEWEGFLGVSIAGVAGNVGEVRLTLEGNIAPVPEPGSLVILGLAGLGLVCRRRR